MGQRIMAEENGKPIREQLREELRALRAQIARLHGQRDKDAGAVEYLLQRAVDYLAADENENAAGAVIAKEAAMQNDSPLAGVSEHVVVLTDALRRGLVHKKQEIRGLKKRLRRETTDRLDAEQDLRLEHEFLSAILNATSSLVVVLDEQGRITRMNHAFERCAECSPAKAWGVHLADLVSDPRQATPLRAFVESQLAGGGAARFESPWDTKWIEWTPTPMRSESGELLFLVLTGNDLTERKRHEEEAHRWVEQLEGKVQARTAEIVRANGELKHLVYALSHDLRGPLRGIRHYVDFLKRDLADSPSQKVAKDLDRLHQATSELDAMMKDLLDYCRLGITQTPRETIDLNEMVQDIRAAVASAAGCEVLVNGQLPTIVAPRSLVRRILQNLIQNGLAYNDSPNRRVEISATPTVGENPRLILTVRDNGIGIAPRHHDKIFDVFHRLHNGEERAGTGIGLAVVRKAVETLGGTIRVESERGEGSTFHVEIPPQPSGMEPAGTG